MTDLMLFANRVFLKTLSITFFFTFGMRVQTTAHVILIEENNSMKFIAFIILYVISLQ